MKKYEIQYEMYLTAEEPNTEVPFGKELDQSVTFMKISTQMNIQIYQKHYMNKCPNIFVSKL